MQTENSDKRLFEAPFGRKPKRFFSNTCIEPNLSKLCYQNFINKYFQQDTVSWTILIPGDNWEDRDRSDAEVKTNKINVSRDAK